MIRSSVEVSYELDIDRVFLKNWSKLSHLRVISDLFEMLQKPQICSQNFIYNFIVSFS